MGLRLKRLTLHGFKSFADRTELDFNQALTGVVGPNGCGKSNIVDAMKWVLGEQSARSLRGTQMQDVIFNGSSNRKAMGMAEVSVSFDTNGQLENYGSEVVISRRLYRSGQSEYLINGKVARLKDIRELFLDTGIGIDAYSLIEQGRVDLLLQASNQERRAVLEEAAGISKYKVRRKEAQRRLETVDQNLLRVTDIVEEVEKRLRSVKLQAGKARNWQEYTGRLQELKSTYYLADYHRLLQQQGELSVDRNTSREAHDVRKDELDLVDAKRSQCDLEIVELSNQISQLENQLTQCVGQIDAGRQTIEMMSQRMDEQTDSLNKTRRRVHQQNRELARLKSEEASAATEVGQVEEDERTLQTRIGELQGRIHDREMQLAEVSHKLETEKSNLIEMMRRSSQLSNQVSQLEMEQRTLASQIERLSVRRTQVMTERDQLSARRTQQQSTVAELDERIVSLDEELTSLQQQRNELLHQADELSRKLSSAKEQRSALRSRYDVLADMEKRMQGVGSGARELLSRRDRGDAAIVGLVADLIRTDMEHAEIVEAALAGRDQHVVVRDASFFEANAAALAKLGGSVNVFSLDLLGPVVHAGDLSSMAGVVGVAANWVRTEPEYEHLVRVLLGKTLIVESLEAAVAIRRQDTSGYRLVTRAGEVIEADGAIRVGPKSAGGGLISRRSEIEHLDSELTTLDDTIGELSQHVQQIGEDQKRVEEATSMMRSRLYECRTQKVKESTELANLETVWQKLERELPIVETEWKNLSEQRESGAKRRDEAAVQAAAMESQMQTLQQGISAMQEMYEDQRQARESLTAEMTELRVSAGRLGQKRQSLTEQMHSLRQRYQRSVSTFESAGEEIRAAQMRILQAERQILRTESRLAELYLTRQDQQDDSAWLRHQRQQKRLTLDELTARSNVLRQETNELQSRMQELALRINELTVRQESLIQRVQEELQVDIEQSYANYQATEVQWESLESEINELKAKIQRLGNVNLDAIGEQDELEARGVFLANQKVDLVDSQKKLMELIERLDLESQRLFVETFESVRANFQDLFRKLFGGGKADLILDTTGNVLESGIDIIARPPGKEPRSVSLLSGGEKTMTTVALLMAIFKSKPSPFCILDEVDAALDEANVDRFNMVLQDFMSHSQFIVITHNRRTMSYAEALYGVTMQEAGVSRRVAVKFNKNHPTGVTPVDEKKGEHEAA